MRDCTQWTRFLSASAMVPALVACSSDEAVVVSRPTLSVAIGVAGGVVEGEPGTALEGVRLEIPDLGIAKATTITVTPVVIDTALPPTAESIGPYFEIGPPGLVLEKPATLTLPVDLRTAASFGQDYRAVKVWLLGPDSKWVRRDSVDTQNGGIVGSVSVSIDALGVAGAGVVVPGATGRCAAPCDTQRSPDVLPLARPAFGSLLAVAGDKVGVLAVEPNEAGATLTGEVLPLGGGAAVSTASLVVPSSSALWPARGLAHLGDGVVVGLEGGLARLPATGGAAMLSGETLAVETAGANAAWIVLEGGVITVKLIDSSGQVVGAPLVTDRAADGPVPTASSAETLVIGAQDHVLLVSFTGGLTLTKDVPLALGSRIDAVAPNGVSLDRAKRLRAPDGLALNGAPDLVDLTGAGDSVYGVIPGASVAVRITSKTVPSRPGAVPPFEASEVKQFNLGNADSALPRAMRATDDGALVVLDRTGQVVVYR